jgi:pilus assembly protein FimV
MVASAAPVAASAVVAASAPGSAPAVAAAAPAEEETSFVSSLLENPLVLPLVGIGVILLAGWGLWRLRGQKKADGGETSFLESRLQPDSFFGASGGQRIDTRDATGAPSSMSYSLSQLDAIGDVDPVAEADVYLAYGRDLQAEEILKEAMRSNPERLAIRTKLLEVYAKRRDTKGYELLATQLYGLTHGEGEDWSRAQELGRTIDPDNALYQPGGAPVSGDIAAPVHPAELLGASTMPQSVVPSPSRFQISRPGSDSGMDSGTPSLDVDLDLSGFEPDAADPDATQIRPAAAAAPAEPAADLDLDLPVVEVPEVTSAPASAPAADAGLDFDLPDLDLPAVDAPATPAAPAPQPAPDALSFDLGGLSLDLDAEPAAGPTTSPTPLGEDSTAAQALPEVAGLDGMDMDGGDADADPLLRKLELAEEFRQIGDVEAARDLLQEVLEKAQGGLRSKAQGMLDSLN